MTSEVSDAYPDCIRKFRQCNDVKAFCERLRTDGFKHIMRLDIAKDVYVGDLDEEFRLLHAQLFFQDEIPSFDDLTNSRHCLSVPVLEKAKFYNRLSSIGSADYQAVLEPKELAGWLKFYDCNSGEILEM